MEELKYYLILASDLTYIAEVKPLETQAESVGRLLFRFSEGAKEKR